MKIIIVNRNYFVTGGPEKYMFTLMENMPQHRFIPFCVAFRQNRETPYGDYFVAPPAGQNGVYFSEFRLSPFQKMGYAIDSIYNRQAKRKLEQLIRDTRPDLALFLNAVYFSDSIIDACRRHNVPVICRLSDFHRVCANYTLYRDGKTCEECIIRGLHRAIVNRCGGYQRSRAAACVKVAGMWLSRLRRVFDHVDYFVAPSNFMRRKMIEGGFDPEKIVHVPTMAEPVPAAPVPQDGEFLFVGRISPEKGLDILLAALRQMKSKAARLLIAGDDSGDYAERLKARIPDPLRSRVEFLGFMTRERVGALYARAFCVVVPSISQENQPNTLLEAMAHGRPAVVSDLGSLREMVTHGETGLLFRAGDARDLAVKLDALLDDPERAREMGRRGREYVAGAHALPMHLAAMEDLFRRCVERRGQRG